MSFVLRSRSADSLRSVKIGIQPLRRGDTMGSASTARTRPRRITSCAAPTAAGSSTSETWAKYSSTRRRCPIRYRTSRSSQPKNQGRDLPVFGGGIDDGLRRAIRGRLHPRRCLTLWASSWCSTAFGVHGTGWALRLLRALRFWRNGWASAVWRRRCGLIGPLSLRGCHLRTSRHELRTAY